MLPNATNNKPNTRPRVTTRWVVTFIAAELIVLLAYHHYHYQHHHHEWYSTTSTQRHHRGRAALAQGLRLRIESDDGGGGGVKSKNPRVGSYGRQKKGQQPRILTLLTTYGDRTGFARANREALEERGDGLETQMFVASDESDEAMDGTVDYKYGLAHNHRLLGAITEAYARHEGEFEWMAIGDDDTVFLYNRATSFLSHINHTQPVALGSVDGIHPEMGRARSHAKCFSPSEKTSGSTASDGDDLADKGCCRDFTRPCQVPPFPSTASTPGNEKRLRPTWLKTDVDKDPQKHELRRYWTLEYGKGGLFWPYGGSGMFLSAGLLEAVHRGSGRGSDSDSTSGGSSGGSGGAGGGWKRCTEMFGIGYDTDVQLGMCLRAHGLSTSTYLEGFDRTCETPDPDEIQDRLAADCQVLGIHLGIRHLGEDKLYTADAFKDAADAVHREDIKWASPSRPYLAQQCPKALGAISMRGQSHRYS